jgi:translation initiation factor 4B
VREFFGDLNPISVRLVKDAQGKPKGFGYVEFGSKADLQAALDRSGTNLAGRSIRINVADAPASRPGREYAPSAADESNQWRRTTPLPQREGASNAPRRDFSGPGGAGGAAASDADRDWSAARGAKFAPSRESSGYGRSREDRPPREPREHEPTAADEADQWRSTRPLAPAVATPAAGRGGRDAPPHRATGPADTESTWSRGTRVPSGPAAAPEPASRQRLNLLPRTAAAETAAADADAPSKPSPFGGARPVDSAARDREAESHLEEKRKTAADAAAAKREAEAARKEKEAKAKEAREAAQAAQAQQRRPVRVHPSRLPPKEVPQADADGFETVSSRRAVVTSAPAEDKPAPAAASRASAGKAGFSFAAAAGALDGDEADNVADKLAETKV